ncbi:MAG: tetratricopeptide repeat protein [Planctomycetota bacterium]
MNDRDSSQIDDNDQAPDGSNKEAGEAERVVEIPAPVSAAEPVEGRSDSNIVPKLLGVIGLALVAVLGYGSTNNWFGLFEAPGVESASGETTPKDVDNSDVENADANTQTNLSSNGTPSEPQDTSEDLPPLDPIAASLSAEVIEECKRVANHLYATMPNSLEAREMLARTEYEFGDTSKAEKIWNDILKLNPQFLYALRGLGDLATAEGKLTEAVGYYQQAAKYEPQSVTRKITLGVAMTQAAQLDEAKAVLEEALKQSPDHGGALSALGQILALQRDFDAAKEKLESALNAKIRPDNLAKIHLGLVQAYQRLGDKEKVKFHQAEYKQLSTGSATANQETKEYDDLAAIREDVGRFYVDMARVYLAGGFSNSATALLIRTSQMDKSDMDCRQALAFFSLSQEKPYDAIRWLGELRQLQPDSFSFPKEISRLYVQVGDLEKGEKELLDFLKDHPEHQLALRTTAMYYYSLVPAEGEGTQYAERLVKLQATHESYALLASIHDAAGKNAEAITAMEKAVELAPENEKYAQALKVLTGEITPPPKTPNIPPPPGSTNAGGTGGTIGNTPGDR